jgi:hypothetical protein
MALTRVERFAGPVSGEMARMIDEARSQFVVRGRLGRSAVALGKAVDAALAEHAKPESVTWTTRREDDGRWRVQVAWWSRGKTREAAWWYEPHAKALEPVDPHSAALGHVDGNPAPPRRTAKKAAPASAPVPEKKPAAARKPAVKKPSTPKAGPKAAPQAAPKPAPAPKAQLKAAPAARPRLQVVPDPPAVKKAAPKARPTARPIARPSVAEERDGVKARASVPAWADVLLGTTPSNDH